jgi:hypothetical protein
MCDFSVIELNYRCGRSVVCELENRCGVDCEFKNRCGCRVDYELKNIHEYSVDCELKNRCGFSVTVN